MIEKTHAQDEVLVVENAGAVRILFMNRPERLNALNTALTRAPARCAARCARGRIGASPRDRRQRSGVLRGCRSHRVC